MALAEPWVVGLTGGIGCGKSRAAHIFATLGARVIDTDDISHALSHPPSPALDEVARQFGPEYISADGSLDRARMRACIFADSGARARLEAIFHPMIQRRVEALIRAPSNAPYTVLVVPLLFETGSFLKLIQHSVAIHCAEEVQIARVMARSKLSREEIMAIMATQIPAADRIKRADALICNDGSLEELDEQVRSLHQHFLILSNSVQ